MQHHRRDVVKRGAVWIRLSYQPQALDAGGEKVLRRPTRIVASSDTILERCNWKSRHGTVPMNGG